MVFLLVIATLAAPILAIWFAERMRQKRREKSAAATVSKTVGGVDRKPQPGWVTRTIRDFEEGRK